MNLDNILKSDNYQTLHFGKKDYSYGWGNLEKNKIKISSHDGSTGTFYCHTLLMPGKDIAIIVMINTAEDQQVEALYELRELVGKEVVSRK